MESNKIYKKEIKWGFKTIQLSQDKIKLFEEVQESYHKLDTELMKSNFNIVKNEIVHSINRNKTLNEMNSELAYNISYLNNQISKYSNITPSTMDLIASGKMNAGMLDANKFMKKMIKRKVIENQKEIIENKDWLKLLKVLKENLRIYIYESQLT